MLHHFRYKISSPCKQRLKAETGSLCDFLVRFREISCYPDLCSSPKSLLSHGKIRSRDEVWYPPCLGCFVLPLFSHDELKSERWPVCHIALCHLRVIRRFTSRHRASTTNPFGRPLLHLDLLGRQPSPELVCHFRQSHIG